MNALGLTTILLSVSVFAAGVALFAIRREWRLTQRLLALTICVIAAILFVRLSFSACGLARLSPTLLTEVMQAFSLDADYSVLNDLYGAFGGTVGAILIVVYATLLYTTAPIIGGAVIYDVLAGVSPSIRLWFVRRRPMFIFSQVNEASVALAEDIARRYEGQRRIAVLFVDLDSSAENGDGLLSRLGALEAIRLDADISGWRGLRHSEKCNFFLMDRDADGFSGVRNLMKLDAILEAGGKGLWDAGKGANILFFSDDSETIECVRAVKAGYDERKRGGEVSVNVVRMDAQTCCTLLTREPMYGPLGAFEPGRALSVVLVGDGPLAKEMFKTIYWCGQMLDTSLGVSVIVPGGDAEAAAFEAWLNHLNPEILESCTAFGPDGQAPSDCLRIRPRGEGRDAYSPPYCSVDFIGADLDNTDLWAFLCAQRRYRYGSDVPYRLMDADYLLVMRGEDEQNLALADDIRRQLLRWLAMPRGERARAGRAEPRICVEIRGDAMRSILESRFAESEGQPRLIPFGSYRARYSWDNVFLDEEFLSERGGADASGDDPTLHGFVDINSKKDSIYDSWANIGRNVHLPYKIYYMDALKRRPDANAAYRLTWLEHRRWCAFLRAQGFRRPFESVQALIRALPDALKEWASLPRAYAFKDISARLHPCLVECAEVDTGLPAWLEAGLAGRAGRFGEDMDAHDLLDVISMVRTCIEGKARDLKSYDLDGTEKMLLRHAAGAVSDDQAHSS